MANQGYEFTTKLSTDELLESPNIAALLSATEVAYIGNCVKEGYDEDVNSRSEWEKRNARALELALQVQTVKSFPWTGSANVKFPLITVAALQYQARAYPALIDGTDLVNAKVYGPDPDGKLKERAERVGEHMTWQCVEQDPDWEENHDKALLIQAILGNCFIKTIFDPATQRIVSQLVSPKNFVANYFTQDLPSAQRFTHVFELTDNAIKQREIDGRFIEPIYPKGRTTDPSYKGKDYGENPATTKENPPVTQLTDEMNKRQGLQPPPVNKVTPWTTGEMYCWWDLDGDGFEEPYIVTFQINSGAVRRIVARYMPSGIKRYRDQIYEICPLDVFTKIPFIPSPDGGFYDLGLGSLLGPINESVNTALNQIFDAGTMATLGGGFVGRGFKNRGGAFTFRPFEWYPVDAPGDDLRKNVLPLPVREPSSVLFQVLGLLIQYGERIVAATDIQLGENPGQNTPAETTRTLNENGSRVYNAIYKRTWRALKGEYCIRYQLNKYFLPVQEYFEQLTTGASAMIARTDYQGDDIQVRPAADPHVASDTLNQMRADKLLQFANSYPGANRYECGLLWIKANKYQNAQKIYPPLGNDPQTGRPMNDFPPPPPDPKMITAQANAQKVQADIQESQQQMQLDMVQMKIDLMTKVNESAARVNELNARATLELAQEKAAAAEPYIKMLYAQIESEGREQERLLRLVENVTGTITEHNKMRVQHSIAAMGPSGSNGSPPKLQHPLMPAIAGTMQGGGFNGPYNG